MQDIHNGDDDSIDWLRTRLLTDMFFSRLSREEGDVFQPPYIEDKRNTVHNVQYSADHPEHPNQYTGEPPSSKYVPVPISYSSKNIPARDRSPVRRSQATRVEYTICVRDWRPSMTTEEFVDLFSIYGPIAHIIKHKHSNANNGKIRVKMFAFVRYEVPLNDTHFANLQQVENMYVCNLCGDRLVVNYAKRECTRAAKLKSRNVPYFGREIPVFYYVK